MNVPKLHHYAPQFYLRRFADANGQLWLWDLDHDRTFLTQPHGVAAENNFYWHEELAAFGHDPLTVEKQFSQLGGDVARISGQRVEWLRNMKQTQKVEIPAVNRDLVSLYIALQVLRTAGTKDILATIAEQMVYGGSVAEREKRLLHLRIPINALLILSPHSPIISANLRTVFQFLTVLVVFSRESSHWFDSLVRAIPLGR